MGLGLGGGASGITPDPVMDLVLRKAVEARLSRYALLLGVVRAEAFLAFSSADEQFGLEADRRTRILRTFVRNTYRYHRSEILATILNEYTDWERPVQHPVNLRDETLEALSDAQVVAPVVLTADVHSNTAANKTFLYVFDYQTKYGDYQQRQGCIHGEDLAYVLGAPLSAGLRHSHLPRNFTKSEAMLSEATMNYWINFARTGNPNDPIEPSRGGRHRSLEWPPYENLHKYIVLEPKPRIKSHYRAHRLSFWLHLVPELHRPGGEGVPLGHHQMPGDPPDPPTPPAPPPGPGRGRPPAEPKPDNATRDAANTTRVVTADPKQRAPAPAPEPQPNPPGTGEGAAGIPPPAPDPTPSAGGSDDGFAAYSTALSATVAIGCSLLLLNVLVFACVYHQREKPHENCRAAEGTNNSFRSQGSGTLQSALKHKKRPVENGTPRGMCKAEHLQSCVMTGGPPTLKTFLGDGGGHPLHRQHHFHLHCGPGPGCPGAVPLGHQLAHSHSMHQLPPPDFDDLPSQQSFMLSAFSGSATLPRPPPPPKLAKLPPSLQCEGGGGVGGEDQPLLSASAHNLHTLVAKKSTTPDVACGMGGRGGGGCSGGSVVGVGPGALGTIRRKGHGQRGPGPPGAQGPGPGQYCATRMEELRV